MSAKKSLHEYFNGVTRFGMLTVISDAPNKGVGREARRAVTCLCDCGVQKDFHAANVRRGLSTNCGCAGRKRISELKKTHGMSKTRQYGIWCGMKDRCYNEKDANYPGWGGRGIKVCDEWKNDFLKFYEDIGKDMPLGQTHSLHRIDNDKDYSKDNCMWATRAMQANNRRNTPRTNINGEDISLAEFAAEMGIKYHAVYHQCVTLGKGLHGLVEEMQQKLNRFRASSAP